MDASIRLTESDVIINVEKLEFRFTRPYGMKHITSAVMNQEGFIEAQTNMGEEYIDLLECWFGEEPEYIPYAQMRAGAEDMSDEQVRTVLCQLRAVEVFNDVSRNSTSA